MKARLLSVPWTRSRKLLGMTLRLQCQADSVDGAALRKEARELLLPKRGHVHQQCNATRPTRQIGHLNQKQGLVLA